MTATTFTPALEEVETTESAAPRRRRLPPLAVAVLALVAIPTVVFVGADLFGGHLLLAGDNLIQSYPLHVLVGSEVRNGQFPGWDPYVWSGTPLLAGLNAGALYPTTLLFAVMNPHAAWILGEIFIFSSVGVGTCLLLSESGISPFPAFLGAAVFAFGGSVLAQASVHTDMADGLASLPWVLLAARRITTDGRWRWAVLLGVALGLSVVSGSPEATLDIITLTVVYAALRWSLEPRRWRPLVTRGAAGAALALALSAALWVPGLHFIAASQRAAANEAFAGGYAFPPAAGLLAFVPYLEGGLGLFHQPNYFGQSNLGEVACYIGMLPLIAVATLWTPSWGKWLPAGEQRVWYGVLLAGLVLAVGSGTPLEHLIYHVPYYGKQRDAGRNIVDVDLAAAALFAWWVDGGERPAGTRLRSARLAALAPLAVVIAVGALFALAPASLWKLLVAFPPPGSADASIGAALALAAGLAALAGLIAWGRDRLGRRRFRIAVCAFSLIDLALFAAGSYYVTAAGPPTPGGQLEALVRANLKPGGRYILVDSDLYDPNQQVAAGQPDINIVAQSDSVSGYGAIVNAVYALHTRIHTKDGIDTFALQAGWLDPLGADVVVAPTEEFLVPIAGPPAPDGSVVPVDDVPGADPILPGGSVPPPELQVPPNYLSGPHTAISVGERFGWYFGARLHPSEAVLVLRRPTEGQLVRFGLVTASGATLWQSPRRLGTGQSTVPFRLGSTAAVGAEVELLGGSRLGPARLAVTSAGRSYLVAGALARAVTPVSWSPVGRADDFSVFAAHFEPRQAWVQSGQTSFRRAGHAFAAGLVYGSVRVVADDDNAATLAVRTPRAGILAWSTAFDDGWHATVTPAGGAPRAVPTRRVGLVVGADVPAGASTVRFTYRPVGESWALPVSLATVLLLVLLGLAAGIRAVRRRPAARTTGVRTESPGV